MEELVRIATVENEVEARLLESMLSQQGIPFRLRTFHDSALDGIYQLQNGWGYVSAPPEYRETVLRILKNLRDSDAD
jgi:hypothetical protein